MPVPVRALFEYHASVGALTRLLPPGRPVRVVARDGTIRNGERTTFRLRALGLPRTWRARHEQFRDGEGFTDVQERGPFAAWVHTHRFMGDRRSRTGAPDPSISVLEDHVEYRLPAGALGRSLAAARVARELDAMFIYRHARTKLDLARIAPHLDRPRLRVVVSGATGLIGRQLCALLACAGHHVTALVRDDRPRPDLSCHATQRWNPARGEIDPAALDGADAVIHLAGANIGAQRWTAAYKQQIRSSRVDSTRLLAEAVERLPQRPGAFLVASAVGYYGTRGAEPVDERAGPGSGFLAGVCVDWENAAEPAVRAGVRVAHLRIGVVLAPEGGALRKALPWFAAGLGASLAGGPKHVPWIGLDDAVGAIHHVLVRDDLAGPINLVGPQPCSMTEFADTLADVLRRPRVLTVPGWALRSLAGEMAREAVMRGVNAQPARLTDSGFSFLTPALPACLRWELGRIDPA